MKLSYFTLSLLILIGLATTVKPSFDVTRSFASISRSIVVVEIADTGGYGSGTIIESKILFDDSWLITILTAKHVVVDAENNYIVPRVNGVDGIVVNAHATMDVAIIAFVMDGPMQPIPLIRPTEIEMGETLYGMGNGASKQIWLTQGIATSKNRGGFAAPGDSGGAMLDDMGQLIGVIVAVDNLGWDGLVLHHTYIEPIADMANWISNHADISGQLTS